MKLSQTNLLLNDFVNIPEKNLSNHFLSLLFREQRLILNETPKKGSAGEIVTNLISFDLHLACRPQLVPNKPLTSVM